MSESTSGINLNGIKNSPFFEKAKEEAKQQVQEIPVETLPDNTEGQSAGFAQETTSEASTGSVFGSFLAGTKKEEVSDDEVMDMILQASGDDGILTQEEQDELFVTWGISKEDEEEYAKKQEEFKEVLGNVVAWGSTPEQTLNNVVSYLEEIQSDNPELITPILSDIKAGNFTNLESQIKDLEEFIAQQEQVLNDTKGETGVPQTKKKGYKTDIHLEFTGTADEQGRALYQAKMIATSPLGHMGFAYPGVDEYEALEQFVNANPQHFIDNGLEIQEGKTVWETLANGQTNKLKVAEKVTKYLKKTQKEVWYYPDLSKNEARQAAASAYLDSQGALSALNALNGVDKTGLNTSVQEDPELSAKALGMVGELAELEVNEENAKKIEKYILSDSFHETDIPSYTQGFAGFYNDLKPFAQQNPSIAGALLEKVEDQQMKLQLMSIVTKDIQQNPQEISVLSQEIKDSILNNEYGYGEKILDSLNFNYSEDTQVVMDFMSGLGADVLNTRFGVSAREHFAQNAASMTPAQIEQYNAFLTSNGVEPIAEPERTIAEDGTYTQQDGKYTTKYDSNGRKLESYTKNEDGTQSLVLTYEYTQDENNERIIYATTPLAEGEVLPRTKLVYNEYFEHQYTEVNMPTAEGGLYTAKYPAGSEEAQEVMLVLANGNIMANKVNEDDTFVEASLIATENALYETQTVYDDKPAEVEEGAQAAEASSESEEQASKLYEETKIYTPDGILLEGEITVSEDDKTVYTFDSPDGVSSNEMYFNSDETLNHGEYNTVVDGEATTYQISYNEEENGEVTGDLVDPVTNEVVGKQIITVDENGEHNVSGYEFVENYQNEDGSTYGRVVTRTDAQGEVVDAYMQQVNGDAVLTEKTNHQLDEDEMKRLEEAGVDPENATVYNVTDAQGEDKAVLVTDEVSGSMVLVGGDAEAITEADFVKAAEAFAGGSAKPLEVNSDENKEGVGDDNEGANKDSIYNQETANALNIDELKLQPGDAAVVDAVMQASEQGVVEEPQEERPVYMYGETPIYLDNLDELGQETHVVQNDDGTSTELSIIVLNGEVKVSSQETYSPSGEIIERKQLTDEGNLVTTSYTYVDGEIKESLQTFDGKEVGKAIFKDGKISEIEEYIYTENGEKITVTKNTLDTPTKISMNGTEIVIADDIKALYDATLGYSNAFDKMDYAKLEELKTKYEQVPFAFNLLNEAFYETYAITIEGAMNDSGAFLSFLTNNKKKAENLALDTALSASRFNLSVIAADVEGFGDYTFSSFDPNSLASIDTLVDSDGNPVSPLAQQATYYMNAMLNNPDDEKAKEGFETFAKQALEEGVLDDFMYDIGTAYGIMYQSNIDNTTFEGIKTNYDYAMMGLMHLSESDESFSLAISNMALQHEPYQDMPLETSAFVYKSLMKNINSDITKEIIYACSNNALHAQGMTDIIAKYDEMFGSEKTFLETMGEAIATVEDEQEREKLLEECSHMLLTQYGMEFDGNLKLAKLMARATSDTVKYGEMLEVNPLVQKMAENLNVKTGRFIIWGGTSGLKEMAQNVDYTNVDDILAMAECYKIARTQNGYDSKDLKFFLEELGYDFSIGDFRNDGTLPYYMENETLMETLYELAETLK